MPLYAADKPKPKPAPPAAVDPYAEVQPATETLDMNMYQRIRDEGLNRSHVMEFASALMDGIGPRLTGSPNAKKANEWTRDTLTKIGLENAHLEDWGEFGLGWQQLNTWARMVTPDTAVLIVQATPWSPATPGPVTGDVVFVNIQTDKDFDQYTGKLAGKIVLFGAMREVPPVEKALFERYSDKELEDLAAFPVTANAAGLTPQVQARLKTSWNARSWSPSLRSSSLTRKSLPSSSQVATPKMAAVQAARCSMTTAQPSVALRTSPKKGEGARGGRSD